MIWRALSTLYYVAALALAASIVQNAGAASEDYGRLYEHFSPESRADATLKSLLETLSFGWYRGGSAQSDAIEQILVSAEHHERAAQRHAWVLLGISAAFLATHALAGARLRLLSPRFLGHLVGISLIFLLIGLLAPILSLVAYTEVAVLGKVVLRYESKGILTTVVELWRSGNAFIAAILLTFSVVTPLIKLVFNFLAIRSPDPRFRARCVRVMSAIGKWSMADVLVVAILLSFFIASADGFSDSWLGAGLYFFAGYCLLSLLAVQLVPSLEASRERSGSG